MIYSKTGYGKGSTSKNKISVEAEVKSVNSRFFETSLKLPSILSPYDYEIREFIKTKVQRGKLSVVIHFKKDGVENGFISIDDKKLANHLALIRKIKKAAAIKEEIKLEHLLSSKKLFVSQETELSKAEFDLVKVALTPRIRLAKVNTETEQMLASQFRIQSIPTLGIFKNGREVARQPGAMDLNSLLRWIQTYA